jgi:GR25 family glycosyltransferase involved in LPS biosynthesis
MNSWLNNIEQIVYINLDNRIDRNVQMLNEFKRLNIPISKFVRLSAVRNQNGAIGCTLSHIKVIQMAIENKWKNVMVLEDDFNFIDNEKYINDSINYLYGDFTKIKNDWEIVSLSRGARQDMNNIDDPYLYKAIAVSTTAGYIVNENFYDTLLKNYREGLMKLMKETNKEHYTLDAYWINLQPMSKWYVFNPSLGYQRESYSDIEGKTVEYLRYDKTIQFKEKYYLSCNLKGGLGNQMFQIAATCAIAWMNNLNPIFEKISASPPLTSPRPVYWNTVFNSIDTISTYNYNKIQFLQFGLPDSYFRPINLSHNKSYKMDGYFQNPKFFNIYKDRILDLFKLSDNQNSIIDDLYNKLVPINKTSVSIHVRRGDYLKLQHFHPVQDMSYFIKSIETIHNKIGKDLIFLIFSDDLGWCYNNFEKLYMNCIYVDHNSNQLPKDVIDMYLMSRCNHNIISNSSFSWWSAYMNKNPDKIVCIPGNWFVDKEQNKDGMNIVDDGMLVL